MSTRWSPSRPARRSPSTCSAGTRGRPITRTATSSSRTAKGPPWCAGPNASTEEVPVGEKVAIYCGYGPGIILRLFKFVDRQIPGGPNGWHTERIAEETARVEIAGGAATLRGQPAQKPGFARTVIDKSFWTEWLQG